MVAQLVKNLPAMQETPVRFLGQEVQGRRDRLLTQYSWASLMTQRVTHLSAMQETSVQSLGWEDPVEESMATHPSILTWKIPVDRGACRATVHGVTKSWTWLTACHKNLIFFLAK